MPVVLEQAQLLNPALTNLPTLAGSALLNVIDIFNAPPDQPNLGRVMSNVLLCLDAFTARQPEMSGPVAELMEGVIQSTQALEHEPLLDQPAAMIGRTSSFPEWTFISSNLEGVPAELLEVAGVELAQAYLAQSNFSANLASNLLSIAKRAADNELPFQDFEWLNKAILRHLERARHIFSDRARAVDATTASFNARVTASLIAQSSSLRVAERQTSGRAREMTADEVQAVALDLRQRVEQGDSDALLTCLARCIGLPYELCLHVPLVSAEKSVSVVWIHPVQGCIYFDLGRIFSALAKTHSDQHVQTTLLLVIPIPQFIAKALHQCCSTRPGLEKLQSLSTNRKNARSLVGKVFNEAAIKATIARFIASRGGDALRAGIPRDLAAYVTVSLSLVSKSDHHYLVKSRSQIWEASNQLCRHLGWGDAVADPVEHGPAFGSRLTPEAAWAKRVMELAAEAAITSRPGKRCGLASLIRHHNAFASYVALLMHTLLGGRNGKIFSFCASQWTASNSFGQHGDKLVGPTKGLTPLPLPTALTLQVWLWLVHLAVLERRLKKLGFDESHPTFSLISQVTTGKEVPLLFMLDDAGLPRTIIKPDVFCGEASNLSGDFARHLMPGLLEKQGVPFEYIEAWLRHHVEGIAMSSATSAVVQQVWLSAVAAALDRIALDLHLQPIHGIAKKV